MDDRIDTGASHSPSAFLGDEQVPVLAVEDCNRVVDGDLHRRWPVRGPGQEEMATALEIALWGRCRTRGPRFRNPV